MQRMYDSLLTLVGQRVGQLGPVTAFLDKLVTGLMPQITASACGCDYFTACSVDCSATPCSYPTMRIRLLCPDRLLGCAAVWPCDWDCGC